MKGHKESIFMWRFYQRLSAENYLHVAINWLWLQPRENLPEKRPVREGRVCVFSVSCIMQIGIV